MEDDNFVVVQFLDESKDGKKSVDLLHRAWMSMHGGKWACYYPSEESFDHVLDWVRDGKKPESDWKFHTKIKILVWAKDYMSGLRRLAKSFQQADNLASTDDDNLEKSETVLTRHEAKKVLQKNAPQLSPVAENSENSSNVSSETSDTKKSRKRKRKSTADKRKRNRIIVPTSSSDSDQVDDQRLRKPLRELTTSNMRPVIQKSPVRIQESASNVPNDDLVEEDGREEQRSIPSNASKKPKSRAECDLQLKNLRATIDDPVKKFVADYMDQWGEKIILHMTNSKRSILYDIDKIKHRDPIPSDETHPTSSQQSSIQYLKDQFPLETLDDFLKFEKSLNPEKQEEQQAKEEALKKQEALKTRFRTWVRDIKNAQKAIQEIMKRLLDPDVQLQYSGAGRVTKGVGKLKYNGTISYHCIEEVIMDKYSSLEKPILTTVSDYLSGAAGRKGKKLAEL